MKPINISNGKCRELVKAQVPFKANNLHAVIVKHAYIVYSYKWYPLFYCDLESQQWFANSEKYSVSASKHFTQAHPLCECLPATKRELDVLIFTLGGE